MIRPASAAQLVPFKLSGALILALALVLPISAATKEPDGRMLHVRQLAGEQRLAQATTDAAPSAKPALSEGEVRGWRQRIGDAIAQKMETVASVPHDAQVEIDVSVLPSGLAADIATHRTSGYPALDTAVRRAVLAAQPLPLPSDPAAYAQLRRFAVRFEPRAGVHVAEAHPAPDALPPAPPPAMAEPFTCRAGNLAPASVPACQPSASHADLLTCFAQAVKTRTSEVVGACGVDVYPLEARRQNLEGTTYVGVTYDRGGKLSGVAVTESSGQPLLDQRALELIRQSVLPAPQELHAAPFAVRIPVVFRMQRAGAAAAGAPAAAESEAGAAAGAKSAKPAKKSATKSKTATKTKPAPPSKAKKKIKKKKRPLSTQT